MAKAGRPRKTQNGEPVADQSKVWVRLAEREKGLLELLSKVRGLSQNDVMRNAFIDYWNKTSEVERRAVGALRAARKKG